MKQFKANWEITKNWQLIYPLLGVLLSLGFGFIIALRMGQAYFLEHELILLFTAVLTVIFTYLIIKVCLYCFKKLKNKWQVDARWELIAIFIVFAITGSTAGRVSSPIMQALGLGSDAISGWLYWPLRIILIFPLYQVLLIIIGWIFGQYKFFYAFEKKMLSRMGLGFLFKK
ncbi:MAG TPA: prolipoprotein diacylglyceryl transferase [Leeuwenhoekiella sp.]|nr:prolipoprotein diacylglyceryl transferase [Leeuwenhoekiella sp.]